MSMRTTALTGLLTASIAWGTPTFPAVLQSHLSLAEAPAQSCGLCHLNGVPGVGTVTTPFGIALRERGLVASSDASLRAALDAVGDGTDSDGDGTSDLAELRAGTDPNGTKSADGPRYGCGASTVPQLVGLAGAIWLLVRRRRI